MKRWIAGILLMGLLLSAACGEGALRGYEKENGYVYVNLSDAEYKALLDYQVQSGVQMFYPLAATHSKHFVYNKDFWLQVGGDCKTETYCHT